MNDKPNADDTTQWIGIFARARGLERAYALYPDLVAAAIARGSASLGPLPADFSAVIEPAVSFDPTKFAGPDT
jgi:hypothetical protein